MGRLFVVSLDDNDDGNLNGNNNAQIYKCKFCQTHLALAHQILSRTFYCKHGKAYLFNKVANVTVGPNEDRRMMTGMHTVADVFCVVCGSNVGWKYEAAHEKDQKYKEGKFVLERFKILGPDGSQYFFSHDHHHDHGSGSDADDA